jgi:hypothetical protein
MLERAERQVKQSPLKAMLGLNKVVEPEKEERVVEKAETKEPAYKMGAVGVKEETKKKRNERSYKRWRGMTKEGLKSKPMSYYVTEIEIEAILLRTTRDGGEKDKSAVVRAALDAYLAEELQFLSKAKKEGVK